MVMDTSEANVPFSFGRLRRVDSLPEAVVRRRKCALCIQVVAGIGMVGEPALDAGARVQIEFSIHVGSEEFAREIVGRRRGHGCTWSARSILSFCRA